MNGWASEKLKIISSPVAGVVSNLPVVMETAVSAGGALNGIVKLKITDVTQVGTITPKLQTAISDDWVDVKSGAAITAAGTQYIRWNIQVTGDQAVLPLLNKLRVVLTTTNAGDALTISECSFLQEL